jgi:hypothetical protein
MGKGGMTCSKGDECQILLNQECDFCKANFWSGHKHLHIPSSQVTYFKFAEPVEDFVLCSKICAARMTVFLTRCDLINGLPHMITRAYWPTNFQGSKVQQYECFSCSKSSPVGELVRGDRHFEGFAREQEIFFCKSRDCLLEYCRTNQAIEDDWRMEWMTQTVLRGPETLV